jgi:hypothetical protein
MQLWNNSDVTVCFDSSTDSLSGIDPATLTACSVTSSEGADIPVPGGASDYAGNSSNYTAHVNLDKTAPSIQITYPIDATVLDTCQPVVTGNVVETDSGLEGVTCNDSDAQVSGGSFTCPVSLVSGQNDIIASAKDLAGNNASSVVSVNNPLSNTVLNLDTSSPVIARVDTEDEVLIIGEGFNENSQAFIDGVEASARFIDYGALAVSTNFTSTALHGLEIKDSISCPVASVLLDPGILAIRDGDILAVPNSVTPGVSQNLSIYGQLGSFESGASVYFAPADSGCSGGVSALESLYVEENRLDIVTPLLSTGSYDVFVDNPTQTDFCQNRGLSVANPANPSQGYDAWFNCCTVALPQEPGYPEKTVLAGHSYWVTLKVKNAGATTHWKKDADGVVRIGLGSQSGTTWNVSRVWIDPSDDIAPNQMKTFTFKIKAPTTAGSYPYKWQMINIGLPQGSRWFGEIFPCSPQGASCAPGSCGSATCTGETSITVVNPGNTGPCPAADKTGTTSATAALQQCLDDAVSLSDKTLRLDPGTYVITEPSSYIDPGDSALVIPEGVTITSTVTSPGTASCKTDDSHCAILKADVDLRSRIIRGQSSSIITRLIVDGNGAARRTLHSGYCDANPRPSNIRMGGRKFMVLNTVSRNAMCGTALGAVAANKTGGVIDTYIQNNKITSNGTDTGRWSDGITVARCIAEEISNNTVIDATDIGIVDGGGHNCTIHHNHISQSSLHAFAGLAVHYFCSFGNPHDDQGGWHDGSVFQNNIIHGNNKMDFGISAGIHGWFQNLCTQKGKIGGNNDDDGSKFGNTVDGAYINIAIDGWQNGEITKQKSVGGTGGVFKLFTCSSLARRVYTKFDFNNITDGTGLDADPVSFHGGCQDPPNDTPDCGHIPSTAQATDCSHVNTPTSPDWE